MTVIEIDDNLTILIALLTPFLLLFIIAFAVQQQTLWVPAMFCVIVIAGLIAIVVRWQGKDGNGPAN